MMRFVFAVLISVVFTAAYAEDLEPFEKWIKDRPNWTDDDTELAYATTRCGTLFLVVGGVFVENPANQENVRQGNEIRARGLALQILGSKIAELKGMSQENHIERVKLLYKSYAERIVTNRRLHNNMFQGWIQNDFKFCVDFEKDIKKVIEDLRKKSS